MSERPLAERVEGHVREWGVAVEETLETHSSLILFGRRGRQPVVLKVVRAPCDEWRSGEVLEVFGGAGAVRAYEHTGGAVLLERLEPGTGLAEMSLGGRDEEATEVIADVISRMSGQRATTTDFTKVEDLAGAFGRYLSGGGEQLPRPLVTRAQETYLNLCATQKGVRLLHGDLHHYNVLFDGRRGWVAIDPKGIVGEVEYEVGAALRNPYERPALFTSAAVAERRVRIFARRLRLDYERALAWGFAQAVLSVVWTVEDGLPVEADSPPLTLAKALDPAPG